MATQQEHWNQAVSNERFLKEIDHPRFPDWIVVASFYTALHIVGRILVRDGVTVYSHQERNDYLRANYRNLFRLYNPLCQLSFDARYVCQSIDLKDSAFAESLLDRIHIEVEKILNPPA